MASLPRRLPSAFCFVPFLISVCVSDMNTDIKKQQQQLDALQKSLLSKIKNAGTPAPAPAPTSAPVAAGKGSGANFFDAALGPTQTARTAAASKISVVTTTLAADINPGQTVLLVASSDGFVKGQQIWIDKGTANEEVNYIAGLGSIILRTPVLKKHSAGATITMNQVPTTTTTTLPAPTKPGLLHSLFPNAPKGLHTGAVGAMTVGGAGLAAAGITAAVEAAKKAAWEKNHPGQKYHDAITDALFHHHRGKPMFSHNPVAPAAVQAQIPVASMPKTRLKQPINAGAVLAKVDTTAGFGPGDTVKIGDEYNLVKRIFGTDGIIMDHPMNRAQTGGSKVQCVFQKHPKGLKPTVAATPKPLEQVVQTPLAAAAPAGSTVLQIAKNLGFIQGSKIWIDKGLANEEVNFIAGLGSLLLRTPLQKSHAAGAKIQQEAIRVPQGPTTLAPALRTVDNQPNNVQKEKAKDFRTVFFVSAAVILICCCCLCGLAAAVMAKKKKGRGSDRRRDYYDQSDDDSEYSSGEYSEDEYRRYPEHTKYHLQGY